MSTPYHVYAYDGFESAHRSRVAAERAARRGSKIRHMEYHVVRAESGYTSSSHGVTVSIWRHGTRTN